MGVDITGIKKLKSERAKEEQIHSQMQKEELSRQFSATKFVDQVSSVTYNDFKLRKKGVWTRQLTSSDGTRRELNRPYYRWYGHVRIIEECRIHDFRLQFL